jgi:hypothetical protein
MYTPRMYGHQAARRAASRSCTRAASPADRSGAARAALEIPREMRDRVIELGGAQRSQRAPRLWNSERNVSARKRPAPRR